MKSIITLFLCAASLLSPAAKGQQTSQPQQAQPAKPTSLDDDPMFQKLSPEQQAWARQMNDKLNKAVADRKTAIGQLADEAEKQARESANPNAAPHYVYTAVASNNAPAPNAQPAKPAAPSPCAVTPKKPGFFDRLKQHAKQTLQKQADKADAQISKASKGNVDGGVKDATTSAVNQANQPDPCTPIKGQSPKQ
jgi:hypothetical protein